MEKEKVFANKANCSRKDFLKNTGKITAGAVIGGPLLTMLGCEPGIDYGSTSVVNTAEAASFPYPYQTMTVEEVQARAYEKYMEGG